MTKNIYDIRIGENIIEGVLSKGNLYYEYKSLVETLYKNNIKDYNYKFNIELNGCFTTFNNKKYVTIVGLRHILSYLEDEELKFNIMIQVFGIKSMNIVAKTKTGLSILPEIQNMCNKLYDDTHKFDLKQVDLLHDIEHNAEDEEIVKMFSLELAELRVKRRNVKNVYKLLNLVATFFKDHKLNPAMLQNLYKSFLKIESEIKNPIYNKRLPENYEEDWKKKLCKIKL